MNETPKKTRIPSPARSQSAIFSPIIHSGRRSVGSSSRRSRGYIRLSSLRLSPNLENDVILSDNTDISRHEKDGSWWKFVERSPFSQEMLEGRRRHTFDDDVMVEIAPAEVDTVTRPRSVQNLNLELTSEGSGDNLSLISSLNMKQKKLFNKRETVHSDNMLKNIMQTRYSDENSIKNGNVISDEEKTIKLRKKNFFIHNTEVREFPIELNSDNSHVDPPNDVRKKKMFHKKKIDKPLSFEQFMLASSDSEQGQNSGESDANKSIHTDVQKSGKEPREEQKKTRPFFLPTEGEPIRRPSITDSIVSETIGFDNWRMLPSSTMIENMDDLNGTDKGTPFRKSMRIKSKDTRTSIPVEQMFEKLGTEQDMLTPAVDFENIQRKSSVKHSLPQKETNTNPTLNNVSPKKQNTIANSDHQDLDNIRTIDSDLQKEHDDTRTYSESIKRIRNNRSAHLSNQSLSNQTPLVDQSVESIYSNNEHSSSLNNTSPRKSGRLSNRKQTSIPGLQRNSIDKKSILDGKNKYVADELVSSANDEDSTIENEVTIRYSLPPGQRAQIVRESVENNLGFADDVSVSESVNKYSSRPRRSTRSPKQKKTVGMEHSPHGEIAETLSAKSTKVPVTTDAVKLNSRNSKSISNNHEPDILEANKEITQNDAQLLELSIQSKGLESSDSNEKGNLSQEKKRNNSSRQVGKKHSRQKRQKIEQQSDTINQEMSINTSETNSYKHQSAKRFKSSHPQNNLIDSSLPTYITEKPKDKSPVKSKTIVLRSAKLNQSHSETEEIENSYQSTQSIGLHSISQQDYARNDTSPISQSKKQISDITDSTNNKHETMSKGNQKIFGQKVTGKKGKPRNNKTVTSRAPNHDISLQEKTPSMSEEFENENRRLSASLRIGNNFLEIHEDQIESGLAIDNAKYTSTMRTKSTLSKSNDLSSQPSIKDQQPRNSLNPKNNKKETLVFGSKENDRSQENNQDRENEETEHREHQSIGSRSSYRQGFSNLSSLITDHTNNEPMSESNKVISGPKVAGKRGRPRKDKNVNPMKPRNDISQKEKSVIMSKEIEDKNSSQNKSLTESVRSELPTMSFDIVEPLSQVPRSQKRKIVPFLSDKPISLTQEQVIEKINERAELNQQGREKTALEKYLDKIKEDNLQRKQKMEEMVSKSLKTTNYAENPNKSIFKPFIVPKKRSTTIKAKSAPVLMIDGEPYRTPKMFKPKPWVNKRLYNFLIPKLEPKYKLSSRVRAEKFVKLLCETYTRIMGRDKKQSSQLMQTLAREMAKLRIICNYVDFYRFCHEYLPFEFGLAAVPDLVNLLPLPSIGVFAPILNSN